MRLAIVGAYCAAIVLLVASVGKVRAGDRQAEYLQLRVMIGEQRFGEAGERCRALIALYPDYVYLYETLAEIALYAQDLDGAAKYFEERIEDGTGLEMSYFGLGTVYFNMAAYREAALCFDRAIELGNTASECYRSFVYAYERLEGVDASIRFFNSLCHRNPKNPHLWYAVALAYWSKRDYPTVLKSLDEALSRNPAEEKYHQARAAVLLLMGHTREGVNLTMDLMERAVKRSDLAGYQFLASYEVLRQDRGGVSQLQNRLAEESLAEGIKFGQFRWVGWWYERLANLEYAQSMFERAILHARMAFQASRKCLDNQLAFDALVRQVESCMDLGRYHEALQCAYEALTISEGEKDNGRIGRSLSDLAWIYHELGAEDIAMEHAIEALGMVENRNAGNELLMRLYAILGMVYEGLGNHESALGNLLLSDRLIPDGSVWVPHRAVSHGNIGRVKMAMGDRRGAVYHFNRQLRLSRKCQFKREEAYSLINLAELNSGDVSNRQSSHLYLNAYKLSEAIGQRPAMLASALGLARTTAKFGENSEATSWYMRAFSLADSMGVVWSSYLLGVAQNSVLIAEQRECTKLLAEQGLEREAFEFMEKCKLSSCRFELSRPRIMGFCRYLPLSTRDSILGIYEKVQTSGLSLRVQRQAPIASGSRYDLKAIRQTVVPQLELRELLLDACATRPDLRSMIFPVVLSPPGIKEILTDSTVAVVEYCLAESSSLAFIFHDDSMCCISIPTGKQDAKKLVEDIANVFDSEPRLVKAWSANLADFDLKAAAKAYRAIFKPVVEHIPRVKTIIVVPDAWLVAFPFECLVTEDLTGNEFSSASFVIEDFAISYAPTVTSLIRRRESANAPPGEILAIGDPATRVNRHPVTSDELVPSLVRLPSSFAPLPGAIREVSAIEREFEGKVTSLIGREATKEALLDALSSFAVVHIAAHGSFDHDNPPRSSIFLASSNVDELEGALYASELSNLQVNANLIVLSSCYTIARCNGNVLGGFVEAFQLSGASDILGALWGVEDHAGRLLMTQFYQHLASGERASEALRKAKLDLIRSGKSDPFYWASFLLIGEGPPLGLSPNSESGTADWVFATMVAIAGLGFLGLGALWHHLHQRTPSLGNTSRQLKEEQPCRSAEFQSERGQRKRTYKNQYAEPT